jgi:hypothetical protein
MPETDRERIIRLEMIVEHQNQMIEQQNKMIEKMSSKLDKVHDILSQTKGGWRTLLAVASVTAFLTSFIWKAVPFLSNMPK